MHRATRHWFGIAALATAGLALGGCADAPRVVMLSRQPTVAQLQTVRGVDPAYVYYPDYELYYSRNYQQYVFRYNYGWMHQMLPPAALVDRLPTARAVPMNFRDDPVRHHAEISRLYPRNPRATRFDLASNR